MTKIEWFEERTGDTRYQHINCGWEVNVTDSPHRELYIRNAEREDAMMRKALSESIFSEMQDG